MSAHWPSTRIATTSAGAEILVSQGKKGHFDFRVRVREPEKRLRTPKHVHVVVDLYMKAVKDPSLTSKFVDFVISEILAKVTPSAANPPSLQVHAAQHSWKFQGLDQYGEYPVEYLLYIVELIAIQERTNYKAGHVTSGMFEAFRNSRIFGGSVDLYSVISTATWRGRRAS